MPPGPISCDIYLRPVTQWCAQSCATGISTCKVTRFSASSSVLGTLAGQKLLTFTHKLLKGLPWWLNGKEPAWQCRRCKFKPWLLKIPWRRKWQPTPVFSPRESRGQRRATVCVAAKIQTGPGDWTTKEQSILRWKMDRREKIILGNSLCLWLLWKQNYWAKLTTMI